MKLLATALLSCFILSSCFTGIEGTPRITSADARRAGVASTAEAAFAAALVGEAPRSWQSGKQWLAADDKIAVLFTAETTTPVASGDTLALAALGHAVSLTGDTLVQLQLTNRRNGQVLKYTTDVIIGDWQSRPTFDIPFTVDLDVVQRADSLLRGKRHYILTPLWYNTAGKAIDGLRYLAVDIASVTAGTATLPLRVTFTTAERPDAGPYAVLLTYGTSKAASRNFDRLFSFTDPRLRYPSLPDDHWQAIQYSRVLKGMTRDEARLALGAPDGIERGATRGGMQLERWSYTNGLYLLFEDDYLIRTGR